MGEKCEHCDATATRRGRFTGDPYCGRCSVGLNTDPIPIRPAPVERAKKWDGRCGSIEPGGARECTRVRGHDGEHVAHQWTEDGGEGTDRELSRWRGNGPPREACVVLGCGRPGTRRSASEWPLCDEHGASAEPAPVRPGPGEWHCLDRESASGYVCSKRAGHAGCHVMLGHHDEVVASWENRAPDAPAKSGPCCGEMLDHRACTKPKGHEGDHVAHGSGDRECDRWPQDRTALRVGPDTCGAREPMGHSPAAQWRCTRDKGHAGLHGEVTVGGSVLHEWPDPTAPVCSGVAVDGIAAGDRVQMRAGCVYRAGPGDEVDGQAIHGATTGQSVSFYLMRAKPGPERMRAEPKPETDRDRFIARVDEIQESIMREMLGSLEKWPPKLVKEPTDTNPRPARRRIQMFSPLSLVKRLGWAAALLFGVCWAFGIDPGPVLSAADAAASWTWSASEPLRPYAKPLACAVVGAFVLLKLQRAGRWAFGAPSLSQVATRASRGKVEREASLHVARIRLAARDGSRSVMGAVSKDVEARVLELLPEVRVQGSQFVW